VETRGAVLRAGELAAVRALLVVLAVERAGAAEVAETDGAA